MTAPSKYLSEPIDMFPDGPALPLDFEWMPGGQILNVARYRRVTVEMFYSNNGSGVDAETGQGEILPVGSSVVAEPLVAAASWCPWDWEDDSGSSTTVAGHEDPSWLIAAGTTSTFRNQLLGPRAWLLPLCTNYAVGEGVGYGYARLRKTLDVTDVRWLQFWVREFLNTANPGDLELVVCGAV